MNKKEEYDWLAFSINFILGALPTFIGIGALVWKYSLDSNGSTVLLIATVSSLLVGLASGIWKTGFWLSVSDVTKYSPYVKNHK